jgi:hypothetical protein
MWMGLLGWFKRTGVPDHRARVWRAACLDAATGPDADRLETLSRELGAWQADEDDIEIEREMLDGLGSVVALARAVRHNGLPVVETGHRVVGADPCHFTASCSMPDEPGQPAGRLLLTGNRAIFVGGPRGTTIPLHAVGCVIHAERDLVLTRTDRELVHRFRCNSFGDAFRGAFVARELVDLRRRRPGL